MWDASGMTADNDADAPAASAPALAPALAPTSPQGQTTPVLTVAQVRAAEAATMLHIPEDVLMDAAALAVANEVAAVLAERGGPVAHSRVVALVGPGNNGGDALLALAELARRDAEATAVLVTGTAHARALTQADRTGADLLNAAVESGLRAAQAVLEEADVVIDGIAGIGSTPGLRPPAKALVASIPDTAAVVAVDIPSGLDADSGAADASHVAAHVTVTFTALKPCLVTLPAAASAGRVVVADVGVALPPAGA